MSTDLAYDDPRPARPRQARRRLGSPSPAATIRCSSTPWRIGRAGSAALGAIGLAVSDLWRLRTGRPQAVTSTATRRRPRCAPTPTCCRTASGRYRGIRSPATTRRATAGTMFLHTNHPHHRAGALRIAGAASDDARGAGRRRRQMGRARHRGGDRRRRLRRRPDAQPRGMERPSARHRRRQAAADRHRQDRRGAGRGRCRRASGRLSGVRVLDLTRVLAGPTSGRVLAENGADVLHIAAPHLPYQTELLMDTGHGKRCAWVDLREPAGIETLKAWCARPTSSPRAIAPAPSPRAASRPSSVAALRPGIVCVSICAYGHDGPWADAPRLRFDRAERHGPCRHARLARQAAQPAGPGARLHRGLSRRAGRHGRRWPAASSRAARGWCACRWSRSRTGSRASARSRRRHGVAELPEAELAALPDGKRRPVRPSAPPQAGDTAQRDAALSTPSPPSRSAHRRRAGLELAMPSLHAIFQAAKSDLSKLIARAEVGEEVVLLRRRKKRSPKSSRSRPSPSAYSVG